MIGKSELRRLQRGKVDWEGLNNSRTINLIGQSDFVDSLDTFVGNGALNVFATSAHHAVHVDRSQLGIKIFHGKDLNVIEIPIVDVVTAAVEIDAEHDTATAHVGTGNGFHHGPRSAGVVTLCPGTVPSGASISGCSDADGITALIIVKSMLETEHNGGNACEVDGWGSKARHAVELRTPVKFGFVSFSTGILGCRDAPVGGIADDLPACGH